MRPDLNLPLIAMLHTIVNKMTVSKSHNKVTLFDFLWVASLTSPICSLQWPLHLVRIRNSLQLLIPDLEFAVFARCHEFIVTKHFLVFNRLKRNDAGNVAVMSSLTFEFSLADNNVFL